MQGAIQRLHDMTPAVISSDWHDLEIEGAVVFCAICEAINNTRCVVADITDFNFNVLFELGFAIGLGKRVWPIVQEGSDLKHLYQTFDTVTTVGHSTYKNSKQLFDKVRKKSPWDSTSLLPILAPLSDGIPSTIVDGLLYLQSGLDDEPSLRVSEEIETRVIRTVVDDPNEVPFPPLTWYLEQLRTCFAVLIDLGSLTGSPTGQLQVAKRALVAGIALASGRKVTIITATSSFGPVDYKDLVLRYGTASAAVQRVTPFLDRITSEYAEAREQTAHIELAVSRATRSPLEAVDLGDPVAQMETEQLSDYFVETPEFVEARRGGFQLYVGRKGTGKSALAYMLRRDLHRDRHNLVRVLSPKPFELKQVLEVSERLGGPTRGRMLESLWEYMLSTEAIAAIHDIVGDKTLEESWSKSEREIQDYVAANPGIHEYSFASRLVEILKTQGILSEQSPSLIPEGNIVGVLQKESLGRLRQLCTAYMHEQDSDIWIIIDEVLPENIGGKTREIYGSIIGALIQAASDLQREWATQLAERVTVPRLSILVFLRSDIFAAVSDASEEPDRLNPSSIYWDDIDVLIHLVERRITASISEIDGEPLSWDDLLESDMTFEAMKKILTENVLYRPRDIIFVFKEAIKHAQRREATHISKRDLTLAIRDYSSFALDALSAEWTPDLGDAAELLIGFMDGPTTFTGDWLSSKLAAIGIEGSKQEDTVRFLVESQFLGLGVGTDEYRFALSPSESTRMKQQAARFIHERAGARQFRVHSAFHESLSLSRSRPSRRSSAPMAVNRRR